MLRTYLKNGGPLKPVLICATAFGEGAAHVRHSLFTSMGVLSVADYTYLAVIRTPIEENGESPAGRTASLFTSVRMKMGVRRSPVLEIDADPRRDTTCRYAINLRFQYPFKEDLSGLISTRR